MLIKTVKQFRCGGTVLGLQDAFLTYLAPKYFEGKTAEDIRQAYYLLNSIKVGEVFFVRGFTALTRVQ